MPLINCPECTREISDQSNCCIGCGFPLKKLKQEVKPPPAPIQQKDLMRCNKCKSDMNKNDLHCPKCNAVNPLNDMPDWARKSLRLDPVKEKKKKGISFMELMLVVFIIGILAVIAFPSAKKQRDEQGISIPMSEPSENGRYYLHRRAEENGITTIIYQRKGDVENVYSLMEINCKKNRYRKIGESTTSIEAITPFDAKWIKPDQQWTHQDIVKYICSN